MKIQGVTIAAMMLAASPAVAEVEVILQSSGSGDNAFIGGQEIDRFDRPGKSGTGARWMMLVRNTSGSATDTMFVTGAGTTANLVALEGTTEFEPGRFFSTSDRYVDINESGDWVGIGNLLEGSFDDDEVVYAGNFDGSSLFIAAREGQTSGAGPVYGSGNYGPSITNDGVFNFGFSRVSSSSEINYYAEDGDVIVLQHGDIPANQSGGTTFTLETPFSGRNAYQFTSDGSSYVVIGELSNGEQVLIKDGAVGLQQNEMILGEALDRIGGEQNILADNGDWYTRADTVSDRGLAIRNGAVLAAEFDPVGGTVPGELWDDDQWTSSSATCFFLVTGDSVGNYVLGGFTDNPDPSQSAVWMYNGTTEVLRTGTQIDLDTDGELDDAYVAMESGFSASPQGLGGFLADDGYLYTNIDVADGDGNLFATAFIRVSIAASPCPWDLDASGAVDVSDLLQLLADWGDCPGCPADFDGNDIVDVSDLLELLANWGPCPE